MGTGPEDHQTEAGLSKKRWKTPHGFRKTFKDLADKRNDAVLTVKPPTGKPTTNDI